MKSITFKVTEEQYKIINKEIQKSNETMSNFVRKKVLYFNPKFKTN